ncbi:MAG: relaxase/mobilization nuclease domain-containing protein [Bacteroidota bacterium]
MIGKAKSNKSLAATIAYKLKEKATLVYSNKLEGDSLVDYQLQMHDLQKCYQGYGKQLTIHTILSPAITDGQQLSEAQWQIMADSYLQKMNMKELQAIGFIHTDRGHKHLHLVINKVRDDNFKVVSDSYIGKKTQQIADTIACEMKLVRAMQIRQERITAAARIKDAQKICIQLSEQQPVGIKQQFKESLEQILKTDFRAAGDYFKALENAGFIVHQYHDKQTGELRGYGIEKEGAKMDASAISKKFTLNQLKLAADAGQRKSTLTTIAAASQVPKLTLLNDTAKIAALKNLAVSMGIAENILIDNTAMVQLGNQYFISLKNDSGG